MYEQYQTATSIEDKWNDLSLIGRCWKCGWDDSPIINIGDRFDTTPTCKWCRELSNITWHLHYKSTRPVKQRPELSRT